ncbi:hypothetical protein CS542_07590 [Pedobacter sp. IW39]|nr:hypothetical protein CS542_07590 [Pedobacter sp. IW39]
MAARQTIFPISGLKNLLMIDQDLSLAYLLHQLKSSRYDWRAEKSLADLLIQLQGTILRLKLSRAQPANEYR